MRSEYAANLLLDARTVAPARVGAHALMVRGTVAPQGWFARVIARIRVYRMARQ